MTAQVSAFSPPPVDDDSNVLLPAQVFGWAAVYLSRTGSSRLMHAVLEQAIVDLARPHGTRLPQQRAYRDAYWWVASNDRVYPFSFPNVCDTLGYDAPAVRAVLLRRSPLPARAVLLPSAPVARTNFEGRVQRPRRVHRG